MPPRKAHWEKKRKTRAPPRKMDRKSKFEKDFKGCNYTPLISGILAGVFCNLAAPGQEQRRMEVLRIVNEAAYGE